MSGKDINRYLVLLDRKLFIVAHSGVEWEPEYSSEMEAIDQELAGLRKLVDQEHERRGMEKKARMKAFASEPEFEEAYVKFLAGLPQAAEEITGGHERMESSFMAYLDAFERWIFRHAYECGYAAAMAADSGGTGAAGGEILEQLKREALHAQHLVSETLLYEVYGKAKMARELGAITEEGLMEIGHMMVLKASYAEYIRSRYMELFHGSTTGAEGDGPVKEYRVRYWDRDGVEKHREFDSREHAQGFYDRLDGKAEIQRYIKERHGYEAVVYPTFEV